MYTEDDYAPLITKHNIDAEAEFLAKRLNQDVWVITRLLREYWKDKVGVEWTIKDVRETAYPFPSFDDNDALEVLKTISLDYSTSWGITTEDIDEYIRDYKDNNKTGKCT